VQMSTAVADRLVDGAANGSGGSSTLASVNAAAERAWRTVRAVHNRPRTQRELLYVAAAVAVFALLVAALPPVPSVTGAPAPKKPFRTFASFYNFYLTEHSDLTNRRLHLVGTSIIIGVMFLHPTVIAPVAVAGCVGYVFCGLLAGMEAGFLEFFVMFVAFTASQYLLAGRSWRIGMAIPLIGYAFAWVGHFYFERNKPASFIYPTFSLMGDFRMWFDCFTAQQKGVFFSA